jgi:hypothetical protein
MLHLLYPSDPFNASQPDEAYAEEFEASKQSGFQCSLFSFEEFETGTFKVRPPLSSNRTLYRGWMLREEAYSRLCDSIKGKGSEPFTSPSQYVAAHHLPSWYPLCRADTPETFVLPTSADFVAALRGLDWPGYFVKDYVKSLSSGRGSIATTPSQVREIVTLIEQYRGSVEGSACASLKSSRRTLRSATSLFTASLMRAKASHQSLFGALQRGSTAHSSLSTLRRARTANGGSSNWAMVRFLIASGGKRRGSPPCSVTANLHRADVQKASPFGRRSCRTLDSMSRPVAIGLIISSLALSATAAESGSVCIAPVPVTTVGAKSLANDTASDVPYEFTVSFDGREPVSVSHKESVLVSGLSLASSHRVKISQAGRPKASFTFRFSLHKSNNLCLWFKPLYESWSLTPSGAMRWCRCVR